MINVSQDYLSFHVGYMVPRLDYVMKLRVQKNVTGYQREASDEIRIRVEEGNPPRINIT